MRGKVGQNLSYLKSYAGRVLIDAMRQSEVPVQTPQGIRVEVITKGTPEAFNGDYTLLAAEPFTVQTTGGSPATINGSTVSLRAKPGQTAQLFLLFPGRTTLPAGLRLIRPGYTAAQADAQVFTTEYINLLARLNTGIVRSMDWLRTNGSEVSTWDGRCKATDPRWGEKGKGGPIEPVLTLCNALGADLWFNVPHKADDDYVRQAATLIRDTLGSGQRVYVEYSNEVWNTKDSIALNTAYVKAQAAAAGMPSYRQWYAKRTSQIAAIFADVFRGQDWREVPLLAGQWGDSSVLRDSLAFGWKPKAVAIAGYVDGTSAAASDAFWAGTQVQKFNETVDPLGVEKLIYEWACVGLNTRDPLIGDAIGAWGRGAFANGISGGCNFVPLADPESNKAATNEVADWTPKCQALADLSAAHPHPLAAPPPDPRDADIARLKALVAQGDEAIHQLTAELASADAERDALKSQLAAATEKLSERDALKAEVVDLSAQLTSATAERDALKAKCAAGMAAANGVVEALK